MTISAPPAAGPLDVTAADDGAPPEWDATQIGRYVFRRLVGSGGMGVVIAAYDPELDREVAIKVVVADEDERSARPVREAQAMARLSHPNVVTVYEVMRIGNRSAIVMELVDGEDLAAWRKDKKPGWSEIVNAYIQAGRGLGAAHRAGIVHRDFKPSNALIDRDGVVRVTDFGLARAESTAPPPDPTGADDGSDAPDPDQSTVSGSVMGTPAYMAPEQHRGEPADARTDQWALACSLYEALYDVRPFSGADRQALGTAVIEGAIRPEPTNTPVPRRIRAAIRRALAAQPAKRFAAVDEFIAALSPVRRAWRVAAGASAIAAAGVMAAVVAVRGQPTCDGLDAPLHAVWTPKTAADLRARFVASGGLPPSTVDRVIHGLDAYASSWTSSRVAACVEGRKGVRSKDVLDRRMRCFDQRLAELSGVVEGLGGADAAALRSATDAVEQLHPIVDCAEAHDSVPRPASPQARSEITAAEDQLARAWAFHSLGQYERALPMAEQAFAVGERTGFPPLTARALVLRGECEDRLHRYLDALATYDRASAAAATARDHELVVEALERAFLVRGEHLGRRTEALAGRPFIELALESAGQPPRARAMWLHFLAILLYAAPEGREEALSAELAALDLWRKLLPPGHVYLVDSLETLGNIQVSRKRLDEAEALFNEVLAARRASRGPVSAEVSSALNNLATMQGGRGNLVAAADGFELASTTARAAGTTNAMAVRNLGTIQHALGRWQAAAGTFASALDLDEQQSQGVPSRDVAESSINLGTTLLALGDLARAAPMLARGLDLARRSGSSAVAEALTNLARLAVRRGDHAGARAQLAEALKAPDGDEPFATLTGAEIARAESGCSRARPEFRRALAEASVLQRAVRSAATIGLAECELDLGAPAAAQTLLEAELAWLIEVRADALAAAPVRFALARALQAQNGDRDRVQTLAVDARAGFGATPRAAEVDRWLQQHRR
jgi:eukaryotic-like serine/threonine-protein kinase